MKPILRIMLLGLAVLIVGRLAYMWRFQLEAKIWHWRHGYSTRIGVYEVPVPEHWLVAVEVPGAVNIVNTATKKQSKPMVMADSILFMPLLQSMTKTNIDFWKQTRRQQLEQDGLSQVEENTFIAGDEKVVCIGGSLYPMIMHTPNTTLVAMECNVGGQLTVIIEGDRAGLDDSYKIVSQIKKHS
jgi:hypothetical protein